VNQNLTQLHEGLNYMHNMKEQSKLYNDEMRTFFYGTMSREMPSLGSSTRKISREKEVSQ
jgi:hypothetical protein